MYLVYFMKFMPVLCDCNPYKYITYINVPFKNHYRFDAILFFIIFINDENSNTKINSSGCFVVLMSIKNKNKMSTINDYLSSHHWWLCVCYINSSSLWLQVILFFFIHSFDPTIFSKLISFLLLWIFFKIIFDQ